MRLERWFRKIKILRIRRIENLARNIDLISRNRASYASDYIVQLKREQEANRQYLTSNLLCNEQGESFSLQDLADRLFQILLFAALS